MSIIVVVEKVFALYFSTYRVKSCLLFTLQVVNLGSRDLRTANQDTKLAHLTASQVATTITIYQNNDTRERPSWAALHEMCKYITELPYLGITCHVVSRYGAAVNSLSLSMLSLYSLYHRRDVLEYQ